ncbi:MAG: DNA primase [Alphaproteobacteria bacterium]|nr:DNA primase [Alphaproteobacteria bacterium]
MTSFPSAFLDSLRERLHLSEVIGRRMRLARAGREFKGCCPFHKEKTPSFTVNDEKGFFHCFGCGAHGDVIGFTMRMDGQSFPEAVENLAAQAGLVVPSNTPAMRAKFDKEKHLYDLLERATLFFEDQLWQPAGSAALAYLQKRGLSAERIRGFRLGFAPSESKALIRSLSSEGFTTESMVEVGLIKKSERQDDYYSFFRGRVIFPVADKRGRTVAFGGRVLDKSEPKYLNSPDHPLFHKGQLLYGLSRARLALQAGQPLIVVEGYMDVIALADSGFMGALAPLGTALTENQLAVLWRLLPSVDGRDPSRDYSPILCFDGDQAGLRAATRAAERVLPLLNAGQSVRFAYLPAGQDPDSLLRSQGRASMQAVLDQAKPMIDALWDMTLSGRRLGTPEERAGAARALRLKIAQIKDESVRALYKNEMERRFSSAFGWHGGKARSFTPPAPPVPPLAPPQQMRQKILLALMVNYPPLFEDFGEDFATIAFADPALATVAQQLVQIFATEGYETLDVEALYRQFSAGDHAHGVTEKLDQIFSESTYLHAGFARPSRSIEQARWGWKSIWNTYLQEQLHADLKAATRLWHDDPSDANMTRLMALRQQLESLSRESQAAAVDGDQQESAPAGG